ncbi:DNA primase [Trichinella pseudospiralis]
MLKSTQETTANSGPAVEQQCSTECSIRADAPNRSSNRLIEQLDTQSGQSIAGIDQMNNQLNDQIRLNCGRTLN